MIKKQYTADHDEWLKLRSQYIGGSDAAAVIGLNPFTSPFALWMEKTGQKPPFEGNLATKVGTYLEDFVAGLFEEQTGKKVRRENATIFNTDYPWAVANVDRLIVGEDAGLEIKTVSSLSTRLFKGTEYPPRFYCQACHYMAVTGKPMWYVAVLIGNSDFKVFEIPRDEDEIAALMQAEKDFWENHVVPKIAPPPDGQEPTDESIKILYPESDGESMSLFGRDSLLDRYFDLADQIKELQRQQDEIKQTIQLDMGDTETALADNYKVIWKTQTRSTFDAKKFTADHPDIKTDDYWKTSTSRAFRINKNKPKED